MRCRCTGLVSAAVQALRQVDDWPAENVAAGVVSGGQVVATHGSKEREFRWASVTKLLTTLEVLEVVDDYGIDLDEPAGPPGASVRHLLAHASGLPFEGREPIAPPGRRRIYSNTGFELLAELVSGRVEQDFHEALTQYVLRPLGMEAELRGSAASDLFGTLGDLLILARELVAPTIVTPETLDEATSVQFPGLAGVIPGLGRFDPNDWGLGFELKDAKPGHYSGTKTSPRTFGHWGGSGAFIWVDPDAELALGVLTDLDFGDWAKEAWPALSDAVYDEATSA
jgi:CubicO group peptidase (beta-lactamase class C family)